jgi:2-phospho-L-lactate guanylyltransferase
MTLAILVPIKNLTQAKSRLAPLLSLEERYELAWIMLQGVLRAVLETSGAPRRVVVTNFAPAADLARRLGLEVLEEERQVSESHSVDFAAAALEAQGVTGMLRVPLDLPLIQAADLEAILVPARAGSRVVLVPSLEGTGTNALYRSPPTLFPSHFGPGSLALHEEEARRHVPHPLVLPLERLALDIDDVVDVRTLLRHAGDSPALDYLRKIGAGERHERETR